ncbi:hypothetical protein ACE6H2_002959 [Prunus campanulata]
MKEEDQNQKKKFVCKFCNKRFPCGKSLGGHIRTHLNKKPTLEKEEDDDEIAKARIVKFSPSDVVGKSKGDSGSEAGGHSGYSLRENPKKTWRFVDSGPTLHLQQGKVCKECGKGFQSLKALCGHMACHSEKEKLINKLEETSDTSEKQKLVMDSQSDTETSAPRLRRISKRMKYQNLDVYSSMANGSSSGSGVEQEQQEVAISLMMLSRDSGHKGGLNSFAESSDNNSVVLETKSSSIDMRISTEQGLNCASKVNDIMGMKRARDEKLKSEEITVSDNSDSGYFRHEPKKVESDVSVDGFIRNGEFHKVRAEFGSKFEGYESYDVKLRRGFHMKSEVGKDHLSKEEAHPDQVHRGGSLKYALRKTTKNGFHRPFTNGSTNVEVCRNARKSSKYECLTCKKTFHSHRALGGHRASHTKTNGYSESMYESGENSIDTEVSPVPTPESKLVEPCSGKRPIDENLLSSSAKRNSGSKKSKGHECPFCFKVFRSGQALGGHKRSHFVGGREVKTVVLGQEPEAPHEAEITALFDLNLPAPMEEEANGQFGFMTW